MRMSESEKYISQRKTRSDILVFTLLYLSYVKLDKLNLKYLPNQCSFSTNKLMLFYREYLAESNNVTKSIRWLLKKLSHLNISKKKGIKK